MSNLINFNNSQFGAVRGIEVEGKSYFVANDIAKALGYTNPSKATNDHCKNAILTWGNDSLGRQQQFKVIPEGDVYRLIIKSKLPAAEKFESWVMDEVLPQIRQTGGYIKVDEGISDEEIMARALMVAQNTINKKDEIIANQREELEKKNKFLRQISVSENSVLVREVAKLASKYNIVIGEKKLYQKLRDWGLIFKGSTEPMQKAINQGLFEVTEGTRETYKGTFTYQTTMVTGKGQVYIIERLLKENMKAA